MALHHGAGARALMDSRREIVARVRLAGKALFFVGLLKGATKDSESNKQNNLLYFHLVVRR